MKLFLLIQDESLTERLLGLTEMFPEPVRNFGYNVGTCLYTCIKGNYFLKPNFTKCFLFLAFYLFASYLIFRFLLLEKS